ncbi:hypothetical protein DEO72_LG3g2685 [Vigna unguiculata]|uniref:Uncharacterized protein n=1 Tax=Vigna unguiculata TaxID=3917 RepID=A0A4D6LHV7_VIGUN|nr:hypothetical protein DEO72_LG3g2685 [Vigna unguiculata]
MAATAETVVGPVDLAQASQPRLAETNRGSPRRSAPYFKRASISPKRDLALLPDALFEPSPRRRGLA